MIMNNSTPNPRIIYLINEGEDDFLRLTNLIERLSSAPIIVVGNALLSSPLRRRKREVILNLLDMLC